MAVIGHEAPHIAVPSLLAFLTRLIEPCLMAFSKGLRDYRSGHDIGERPAVLAHREINEAVEECRAGQGFMLLAHVPARVTKSFVSGFA